ncbi:MAG: bifunctional DNA-formamidopyrimidine glycosylase/DNA-(apurinic or apyrimidinic site) lyase [Chloroflexi bacterium]|nr:bifunctional DNA-formamidopyrimidine glycosylase/DNA-(apurinic or apyrimidinic site) lyase [Chloroflexota bacterium]
MPELPEVETLRADLDREILGHSFMQAEVIQSRMTRGQGLEEIAHRIRGQVVRAIGRRGKFLLVHLSSEDTLLLHRGMSGNILLELRRDPVKEHQHMSLELDDGRFLTVYDPRGFGEIRVLDPAAVAERLALMGPEPLGPAFSAEYLARRWASRTAPLKTLLLNQSMVAGLGNIYADECLWAAELSPSRPAGAVSLAELATLRHRIQEVLSEAIECRGTTFSDAMDLYGRPGTYQHHLQVFHRAACPRCRGQIQQIRVANRGTSLCPACQR